MRVELGFLCVARNVRKLGAQSVHVGLGGIESGLELRQREEANAAVVAEAADLERLRGESGKRDEGRDEKDEAAEKGGDGGANEIFVAAFSAAAAT